VLHAPVQPRDGAVVDRDKTCEARFHVLATQFYLGAAVKANLPGTTRRD
jgi:hypothetical protein